MRAKAYLLCGLLWACTTSEPCKAQGGKCIRLEVDCGPAFIFDGYDPSCGESNKCCVPTAMVVDAGSRDGGP
jgi:hypothetical protein